MSEFNRNILVTSEADELFPDELDNGIHCLTVSVFPQEKGAGLFFSSTLSLYCFGLSLVQEAVYGNISLKEYDFSLTSDGKLPIIDGISICQNSSRLFIEYHDNINPVNNLIPKFTISEYINNDISFQELKSSIRLSIQEKPSSYVDLLFKSRNTMYQFGKILLWQSIYKKNLKLTWIKIKKNNVFLFKK